MHHKASDTSPPSINESPTSVS